jgi:hypothetical protein
MTVVWNRFEWLGEYPRQLGCRGDVAVLGRQSNVFRREYPGPTFWTPPIETVPTHFPFIAPAARTDSHLCYSDIRGGLPSSETKISLRVNFMSPLTIIIIQRYL